MVTSTTISKKIIKKLPNKKIFISFIMILISLTFGTLITLANENSVVVETDILNVRYGPGLSHDVLGQAKKKDRLFLLGEENKWYKVQLPNDQIGWVASWLVKNENISEDNKEFIKVTADTVNIRQYSNVNSEIVGVAYKDTEMQVLYKDEDWYQVQYMGRVAWINADYVERIDQPTTETDNAFNDSNINSSERDHSTPASSLAEATIVIDAGHGGHDPGAVEANGLFNEKDITLSTSLLLADRLQTAGTNVILSRDTDQFVSLDDRVKLSHQYHADIFISLHYDAMEEANIMSGTTTYYYSDSDLDLADTINNNLSQNNILPNNGVRHGDYYVLRNNQQPALLIELGYVNHYIDIQHINTESYQTSVVESIYQGLHSYYE